MRHNKIKSVLYIGKYSRNYARNYIFINGLRKQGVNVYEFNANDYKYGKVNELKYFIKNFRKLKNLDIDLILFYSEKAPIPFFFSKILSLVKKVPLVNDIFISKLLTFYYDRKLEKTDKIKFVPKQFYWLYYYFLDFLECHISDYIILDTISHIKYFYEKYKIPIKKFREIYVGARDDIFLPLPYEKEKEKNFIVGFWGSFIPVQGIQYIIKAAKLLENEKEISFVLIGKGQTYNENRELARELKIKNIEFIPKMFMEKHFNKLPNLISDIDVGLGLFGEGLKTLLCIPNKVYEGIAMKIPMITSNTPAIKEIFTENVNIILCKQANSQSLAEAILILKKDKILRSKITENAYKLNKEMLTIEKQGERLIRILNNFI